MTNEELNEMFASIAKSLGEHCNAFVFIAEFDGPSGRSTFAHKFSEPVHSALGLVEAFKTRIQAEANYELLQEMEDADCDGEEDPLL